MVDLAVKLESKSTSHDLAQVTQRLASNMELNLAPERYASMEVDGRWNAVN